MISQMKLCFLSCQIVILRCPSNTLSEIQKILPLKHGLPISKWEGISVSVRSFLYADFLSLFVQIVRKTRVKRGLWGAKWGVIQNLAGKICYHKEAVQNFLQKVLYFHRSWTVVPAKDPYLWCQIWRFKSNLRKNWSLMAEKAQKLGANESWIAKSEACPRRNLNLQKQQCLSQKTSHQWLKPQLK